MSNKLIITLPDDVYKMVKSGNKFGLVDSDKQCRCNEFIKSKLSPEDLTELKEKYNYDSYTFKVN